MRPRWLPANQGGVISIAVCAGATHSSGLMPRLEKQLADAGIPFIVDWQKPYTNPVGRTLGVFCDTLDRLLERTKEYVYLVVVDAWDVLFYGSKDELISRMPGGGVLFGAERNCWPDGYLANSYTGTPWRFMNTGTLAGYRVEIMEWLQAVKIHPAYHPDIIDQQWFGHRLLEGSELARIDFNTTIVYCMMKEQGNLEFLHCPHPATGLLVGRPINPMCGTRPSFIHFNGNSGQQIWPMMELAWQNGIHAGIYDEFNGQNPRHVRLATRTPEEAKQLDSLLQSA